MSIDGDCDRWDVVMHLSGLVSEKGADANPGYLVIVSDIVW